MREHTLDIQGHQIAAFEYNDHIDSTPLIFIHGIGSTIHYWEPVQIQIVNEQYHWYSLSLPGHYPATVPNGFSPNHLTPELVANIMSEAVRRLTGGKPAILIGHSTGGFSSYCIAHHALELVEKLVIIDGFSQGTWHGPFRLAQNIANLPMVGSLLFQLGFRSNLSSHEKAKKAFLAISYDKTTVSAFPDLDDIVSESLKISQNHDFRAIAAWFRVMPHTDIGDWLKTIEKPVHLIHGDKDALIKPEHAQLMDGLLQSSTLTWIEGSGHLPMFERPQDYAAALEQALS